MKIDLKILASVLGVQLLFASFLFFDEQPLAASSGSSTALMAVETSGIDRVVVEGDNGVTHFEMVLEDGTWQLPHLGNFPADQSRVISLLEDLAGLRSSWVVSTDKGDQARFEVADDEFAKRVSLHAGDDKVTSVTFGTSPGFKRTYGRIEDQTAIHDLEFNSYQLDNSIQSWTDKQSLARTSTELDRIEFEDLTLEKSEDRWTISGLAEGDEVDESKLATLARNVLKPRFAEVLLETPEKLDEPVTIRLINTSGEVDEFHLAKIVDKSDWYLKASGFDQGFRLTNYEAEKLIPKERSEYLKAS